MMGIIPKVRLGFRAAAAAIALADEVSAQAGWRRQQREQFGCLFEDPIRGVGAQDSMAIEVAAAGTQALRSSRQSM